LAKQLSNSILNEVQLNYYSLGYRAKYRVHEPELLNTLPNAAQLALADS